MVCLWSVLVARFAKKTNIIVRVELTLNAFHNESYSFARRAISEKRTQVGLGPLRLLKELGHSFLVLEEFIIVKLVYSKV